MSSGPRGAFASNSSPAEETRAAPAPPQTPHLWQPARQSSLDCKSVCYLKQWSPRHQSVGQRNLQLFCFISNLSLKEVLLYNGKLLDSLLHIQLILVVCQVVRSRVKNTSAALKSNPQASKVNKKQTYLGRLFLCFFSRGLSPVSSPLLSLLVGTSSELQVTLLVCTVGKFFQHWDGPKQCIVFFSFSGAYRDVFSELSALRHQLRSEQKRLECRLRQDDWEELESPISVRSEYWLNWTKWAWRRLCNFWLSMKLSYFSRHFSKAWTRHVGTRRCW